MYTVFFRRKIFYPHRSTIWPSLTIWFHKSESIFLSYKLSYQMWNLVSLLILILLTFDFKSYTKSLIYKTGNRPINYRPHTVNWQFLWLNFSRDCFAMSISRDIAKYRYGGDFSFKSCWISWIQKQLKFAIPLLSWMGELPNGGRQLGTRGFVTLSFMTSAPSTLYTPASLSICLLWPSTLAMILSDLFYL